MKRIRNIQDKYFLEEGEVDKIKSAIRLDVLAKELDISYQHLWRKMTKAPKHYLTKMEVQKIQQLTGIEFEIH